MAKVTPGRGGGRSLFCASPSLSPLRWRDRGANAVLGDQFADCGYLLHQLSRPLVCSLTKLVGAVQHFRGGSCVCEVAKVPSKTPLAHGRLFSQVEPLLVNARKHCTLHRALTLVGSAVIGVHQPDAASLLLAHPLLPSSPVRPRLLPRDNLQDAPLGGLVFASPGGAESPFEVRAAMLVSMLGKVGAPGTGLLQSLPQNRQRQPQDARDSAPSALSLQVGSVVDHSRVKSQSRDVDLSPPNPNRRLRGEWYSSRLDATTLFLCVASVLRLLSVHSVHARFALRLARD